MRKIPYPARFVVPAFLALSVSASSFAQVAVQPSEESPSAASATAGGITWIPCVENAALECAKLSLPVDYKRPGEQRFEMAVVRAKSTDPTKRKGVIVVNPGGPGASGVDFVLGGVRANAPIAVKLRQYFDVVSFDPRGVKRSNLVRCEVSLPAPPAVESAEAVVPYLDDMSQKYAKACRDQSGPFVESLGVGNIARDMDVLREALGETSLSYAGISFGTQLGAVYASMFPKRVRAMVLDSSVSPETHGRALLNFWVEHTAGFDVAFKHLEDVCIADVKCPLQKAGVIATFDRVSERLAKQPVLKDGVLLTRPEFNWIIGETLYKEHLWPDLVEAIHGLQEGNADTALDLRKALLRTGDYPAMTPIICGSYDGRLTGKEVYAAEASAPHRRSRFFGRSLPRLADDRFGIEFATALCAAWPNSEVQAVRNVSKELAVSPLFLASRFDNATPPEWTDRMAAALGYGEKSILLYQGGGHGLSTRGNKCVDGAVIRYLTTQELPSERSCPAVVPSF